MYSTLHEASLQLAHCQAANRDGPTFYSSTVLESTDYPLVYDLVIRSWDRNVQPLQPLLSKEGTALLRQKMWKSLGKKLNHTRR